MEAAAAKYSCLYSDLLLEKSEVKGGRRLWEEGMFKSLCSETFEVGHEHKRF